MNVLTSDFETTRFPEGNPFSKHLKAVCLGWKTNDYLSTCYFDKNMFDMPKDELLQYDLCVFFNAKFDLRVVS